MRLHLPIHDPCHENWDAMQEADGKRRFCESCDKHVHDVSAMTEHEAWSVLSEASKRGRVCVRYVTDGETGRIKFKVETVPAPAPTAFSSMLAAAGIAATLLAGGCTSSEPTRIEADRCLYEVGPWSFSAERGEGTCPAVQPEHVRMGQPERIDQGQVIDVPKPDVAVAGGLGAEPIMMGEAPAIEPPKPPPEPVVHERMGKIAAPQPVEHVKMGDIAAVEEPCEPTGVETTPNPPAPPSDRPLRL